MLATKNEFNSNKCAKLSKRFHSIRTTTMWPKIGGASLENINKCVKNISVNVHNDLRAWWSYVEGGALNNGSIIGPRSSDEAYSADELYTQRMSDGELRWWTPETVPLAHGGGGEHFGLFPTTEFGGEYVILCHSQRGGRHSLLAGTSLWTFLDWFLHSEETKNTYGSFLCRSHMLPFDPDMEKITKWPYMWQERYHFVEPEPGAMTADARVAETRSVAPRKRSSRKKK